MKKKFNNNNSNMLTAAALIFAVTLAACGKDGDMSASNPDEKAQDTLAAVAIDKNVLNFGSNGNETYSVSVDNTSEWEVQSSASWVTAEKQPDNTLRISVAPSRSLVDRADTITIVSANAAQEAALLVVTQKAGKPKLYIRQLQGGVPARHCSENGLWVAGQKSTAVVVVDVTKLSDESYTGAPTTMPGGVHSIDNNGKPYENGCSADGAIYSDYDTKAAVDYGPAEEFFPAGYAPYIMRNNRKIALSYPETYATSAIAVEGYVTRHMYQGCIPDKVSADGKHIYGRLMNTNNMWFAAKWTRIGATNNYAFKELGLNKDGDLNRWDTLYNEFEGETYMTIEPVSFLCPQNVSGLSLYGKYACGHYGSSLSGGGQLFRYDMEADRLELLDATGIALYVTDDGTLFSGDNKVYKLGSTAPITLKEWLVEKYGSSIADQIGNNLNMGSVSADYATTVLFDPSSLSSMGVSYIITVEP
ncbi:MAG: BACON domain-containing protein [Prevotellaceae bacterium]|nr:BACON domain-containing protein [Prevotellaceae bacterium]